MPIIKTTFMANKEVMFDMNRTEYYRGKPNTRYGIWNDVSKQFQFNISEDTPFLAIARLYQKIGDDAKKARFEPKKLPEKENNHAE